MGCIFADTDVLTSFDHSSGEPRAAGDAQLLSLSFQALPLSLATKRSPTGSRYRREQWDKSKLEITISLAGEAIYGIVAPQSEDVTQEQLACKRFPGSLRGPQDRNHTNPDFLQPAPVTNSKRVHMHQRPCPKASIVQNENHKTQNTT